MTLGAVFAERALLPEGWASDVLIEIGPRGDIAAVAAAAAPRAAHRAQGPVIPGMPNLHSHAFQRAMAGLTEQAGREAAAVGDSFWTWRSLMYDFVGRLTSAQVEAIAGQLYVEMLKSGYTAVAEFHYLHHDPAGEPYADLAEMSERIVAAAQRTGIGLTLLPVLYGASGFGGTPATSGQRRFLNDPGRFLSLIEALRSRHGKDPQIRIGIAPHSLRAVTPDMLRQAVDGLRAMDPTAPIHIHIAEQTKEVEDCLAWSGQRPVEWLLSNQPVDLHWCLVHATHMTEAETRGLTVSAAVAGLCPTTEANLGDGIFEAVRFLEAGGRIAVGSDSNLRVSAIEELRMLEYGQRLRDRKRNRLAACGTSTGRRLFDAARHGGARALGRACGAIAPGQVADIVVLDAAHPALLGRSGDQVLDAWIFAGGDGVIGDVFVAGRRVVAGGRHSDRAAIGARFAACLARLADRA